MYNEFTVPHEVLEDPKFKRLKPSSRILYCVLCKLKNRYENDNGYFWRSMEMLTEDAGIGMRTLKTAKKELKTFGYIEIERGKYTHSRMRCPDYYKVNGYKEMG